MYKRQLYKRAQHAAETGGVTYRVEAVGLDDPDAVWLLYETDQRDDAIDFVDEAQRDLGEQTRSQFEERYFPKE